MSNAEVSLEKKVQEPGWIIYTHQTPVTRPNLDPELEVVRFAICTIPNNRGMMEGFILDEKWKILVDKIYKFESLDEFFSLNKYILRNGIRAVLPES